MVKPGYKTSEFWFTLVSFLFSGLYLIGLIGDSSQKEDLIRDVSHGVESAILIGGQLAILWKYINSRKQIKQTWWDTASPEERIIADKINDKRGNHDTKRSSKPRTRKTNKSSKTITKRS
jgi:hypothetical protein